MCTATHNSHTLILPRPVPSCHLKAVADFNNQVHLRTNPLGKHTTYIIIAIAYIYIYTLYNNIIFQFLNSHLSQHYIPKFVEAVITYTYTPLTLQAEEADA